MTTRTWVGGTADFETAAAWMPNGVPQPGDTLVIASGNPIASTSLDGFTIDLGGVNAGTGPGFGLNSAPSPDPTLTLGTLDANATVVVPPSPRYLPLLFSPPPSIEQGTLLFLGPETANAGTIETAPGGSNNPFLIVPGGQLTITAASVDAGPTFDPSTDQYPTLTNTGVIIASAESSIVFSALALSPDGSVALRDGGLPAWGGSFANDGTIVDNGTIVLGSGDTLAGTGVIDVNAATVLGTARPALLEIANLGPNPAWVTAGQTIAFHGGHVQVDNAADTLGGRNVTATFANFGATPTDEIELMRMQVAGGSNPGFDTITSADFSNGALNLTVDSFVTSLKFAGHYDTGNFVLTNNAQGVAITYTPFQIHHLPLPWPLL